MTETLSAPEAASLALICAILLLLGAAIVMLATANGRAFLFSAGKRRSSADQAVISVVTGPLAGRDVTLTKRIVLGRDPSRAQLVFPADDTSVSREHCAIRFDAADCAFEVEDLKSSNGTFVLQSDGRPRRLAPGVKERVTAGHVVLLGGTNHRLVLEIR